MSFNNNQPAYFASNSYLPNKDLNHVSNEAVNSSLYPMGIIKNVNKTMNSSNNAGIVRNTSFNGQDYGSYRNAYNNTGNGCYSGLNMRSGSLCNNIYSN